MNQQKLIAIINFKNVIAIDLGITSFKMIHLGLSHVLL